MLKKIKIRSSYLFCVILLTSCFSCSSKSQVLFQPNLHLQTASAGSEKDFSGESLPMEALNSNGKKGAILNPEKSAYIYLAVNPEQLPQLAPALESLGGVSFPITLANPP